MHVMPSVGMQNALSASSLRLESSLPGHSARRLIQRRVLELDAVRPDGESPIGREFQCSRRNPSASGACASPVRRCRESVGQVERQGHPSRQRSVVIDRPARPRLRSPCCTGGRDPLVGLSPRHGAGVPQLDRAFLVRRPYGGSVVAGPRAQLDGSGGENGLFSAGQRAGHDGRRHEGGHAEIMAAAVDANTWRGAPSGGG